MEVAPPPYSRTRIRELLLANDRAVEKAILAIFNRQTESEKINSTTSVHNKVGFSGADARLGTYYANWLRKGKPLSGNHLDRARRMACKYVRQLTEIANAR